MNKRSKFFLFGLAGCTLGLLNLPAAAATNDVNLEFYGHLHLSTDYLYDGVNGGLNVASNASRIGLRAMHDLSDELNVFAQIEKRVDLTEGSGNFSARNTLMGLRGQFGTFRVGYMTSPTMAMLSAVEEFRDRIGDGRNMLRRGAMNLDRRYRNAVNYQTPNMGGFVWTAHYGTNEAGGATVDNEQDIMGTSLQYRAGDWTITGGYQQDNRDVDRRVNGARFSVIREGDGWRMATLVQRVEGLVEGTMTGWLVSGRYQYGENVWLRAQAGARNYGLQQSESTMFTLGADYIVSPRFTWYGVATMTQNDDAAVATVTEGGYGKNLPVLAGEDPFAIGTGVIFRF